MITFNEGYNPEQERQQELYDKAKEELSQRLQEIDEAVDSIIELLIRGRRLFNSDKYESWTKNEVMREMSKIIQLLYSKLHYCMAMGENIKANSDNIRIQKLEKMYDKLQREEKMPEGFLDEMKRIIKE